MAELYNIAIISPSIVKQVLPEIPDSVDDALMTSTILDVQETSLQNLLGCDLYQEILLQQSGDTLTTANEYIYERFIIRILAKGVAIRLIYSSSLQFENSGIRLKVSDQSDPASMSQINTLTQIYKNDVDRISKDMLAYINKNINEYPAFLTSDYCECSNKERQAFSRFDVMGF